METYFENDSVVKYLFNDSTSEEASDFESEILTDANKYEEVADYQEILSTMEEIELSPSKKVTENILNFAKKSNLHA